MSADYLWWTEVHIIKASDLKSSYISLYIENLKDFFQYKLGPALKVRVHSGILGCGDSKVCISTFFQVSL